MTTSPSPFLSNRYGSIVGIEIALPSEPHLDQTITRRAKLIRKTEDADLELTLLVQIDCYNAEGQKMLDVIEADKTITPTAKQLLRTRFASFGFSKTTRDSWVNPATGDLVFPDEVGIYPTGSIPELLYFQHITWENLQALGLPVSTDTPQLVNQYWLIAAMIQKLITREGL